MNQSDILLNLIRLGLGHISYGLPKEIDWYAIQALARQQGLLGIIMDGFEKMPDIKRPPKDLMLGWIGEVLPGYEYRYDSCKKVIGEMSGFYTSHGLKMMVLKGYVCSLTWPRPEHRPVGDIDIWQFGKQKEADTLLKTEKGIKVDKSHHHHTVFYWRDFMVENHYDFINVHHHKSNAELEKIFKRLGQDDSHYLEVYGEKLYLPSPNLHALFLLKHSMNDFTSFSMSLRQLIDWGFFVEKHGKKVDWDWLVGVLNQFHMIDFYNTINAICVEDLGFDSSIFKSVQFSPDLKDKVLNDILYPKYSAREPSCLIPRLIYKYHRWQGNAWKHKLCYNENRWSAFWHGIWGHLLKPASL